MGWRISRLLDFKPKGGPKVPFVIERLVAGREFVDVSKLFGARLTFSHLVEEHPGGGCDLDVAVSITGPLGWLWKAVLGKGLAASIQPDLDRLVAVAEQAGGEQTGAPQTAEMA